MPRDKTYKPTGAVIMTVPLEPGLHKQLRIKAAQEGTTIKALVTGLIERHVRVGGN